MLICINGLYSVDKEAQWKALPCITIVWTKFNIVRLDGFFISKFQVLVSHDTQQNI